MEPATCNRPSSLAGAPASLRSQCKPASCTIGTERRIKPKMAFLYYPESTLKETEVRSKSRPVPTRSFPLCTALHRATRRWPALPAARRATMHCGCSSPAPPSIRGGGGKHECAIRGLVFTRQQYPSGPSLAFSKGCHVLPLHRGLNTCVFKPAQQCDCVV